MRSSPARPLHVSNSFRVLGFNRGPMSGLYHRETGLVIISYDDVELGTEEAFLNANIIP